MSCVMAHLDGAYVLGALGPADRAAYAAHLPDCATCTQAVQDLAGLPGLLTMVDPGDVDLAGSPPVAAPPFLLPALVREARAVARRRTWRAVAGGAAASLVIGASGAWALGAGPLGTSRVAAPTTSTSSGAPTAPPRVMTPLGQDVLTATVAVVPVVWGTRLDLTCTWADLDTDTGHAYHDASAAYALVVRTRGGRTEQVATWQGLPGTTMHVTGSTATPRADIVEVEVRSASGAVVLETAT